MKQAIKLYKYNCLFCKKSFKRQDFRKDRNKFCSFSCYNKKREPAAKFCPVCSKKLRAKNNKLRVHCSYECFKKSRELKCSVCMEKFKGRFRSETNKYSMFCSVQCKMKRHDGVTGKTRKERLLQLQRIYTSPEYQIGLILKEAAKIKASLIAAQGN